MRVFTKIKKKLSNNNLSSSHNVSKQKGMVGYRIWHSGRQSGIEPVVAARRPSKVVSFGL